MTPPSASGRLAGRVVAITGAAQGLGERMAADFAAAGAAVALLDLNAEGVARVASEIEAAGGRAWATAADVTDRDGVAEALSRAADALGPVDALVNNAMWARYGPVGTIVPDEFDRMLAIGVKAPVWAIQAVVPGMIAKKSGAILNLSSTVAGTGIAYSAAYSALKGAIEAMTRALAVELGGHGIRVNALAPGAIPSPMSRTVLGETGWEERRRRTPLGVIGTPRNVSDAALFLLSEEAAFVTGQVLRVDGGYVVGGAIPGVDIPAR